MTFKAWSKHFNPRVEGESIADWLRREVDIRTRDDAPTRSITITPREAQQLLALIEQPPVYTVSEEAAAEAVAAIAEGGAA